MKEKIKLKSVYYIQIEKKKMCDDIRHGTRDTAVRLTDINMIWAYGIAMDLSPNQTPFLARCLIFAVARCSCGLCSNSIPALVAITRCVIACSMKNIIGSLLRRRFPHHICCTYFNVGDINSQFFYLSEILLLLLLLLLLSLTLL